MIIQQQSGTNALNHHDCKTVESDQMLPSYIFEEERR